LDEVTGNGKEEGLVCKWVADVANQ